MKVFVQLNKVLLVVATLCFIFFFVLSNGLSAHTRNTRTVLYDQHDCKAQVLIDEENGAITIRSGEATSAQPLAADFRPGPVGKLIID